MIKFSTSRRVAATALLSCGLAANVGAQDYALLDCVVQPSEVLEISAGVLTGMLEAVYVERGDYVELGQPLARLDARLDEATVSLAQARVDFRAALEASRTARDYFQSSLDRATRLYESEILSSELLEKAEEEAVLAENRYNVEVEAQLLAELELDRAETALEMRMIRSPIAGVVTQRMVGPGESVGQASLLVIAALDPLYVEVVAPAELYGAISVGMTGTVILGDPVAGNYPARVVVVDPVLDAASNTFGIRLELPNSDLALPGGLRGKVRLAISGDRADNP